MEEQIPNALERIENPILIILLAVLMAAGVALWFSYRALQQQFVQMLVENIGALKDVNATLGGIRDAGVVQTSELRDRIDDSRSAILDRINLLQQQR